MSIPVPLTGTLEPDDEYNRILISNVHPENWENPDPAPSYNLVVIGAGTAGLVSAAGAAGLGARVALIERHLMGGDCLNAGCIPSKALLKSARAFADSKRLHRYGVTFDSGPKIDFPAVMERMRRIRAGISIHDSAQRFRGLGIDVFLGEARFSSRKTITISGKTLSFKKAVIATGARPASLPIPGLQEAGFQTNETVFSLTRLPKRLAVIGAGPIGCELAQAFQRFGSQVFLIEMQKQILIKDDPDAASIVQGALERDGVQLLIDSRIREIKKAGEERLITFEGSLPNLAVNEILVAAGRTPNVEHLNLEEAGIAFDLRNGVKVNQRLQTSNRSVFAAGDVCSPFQFTHAADAMARMVIQNALFLGRKRVADLIIPWCTYTDPEIAHLGLSETEARRQGLEVRTFIQPFSGVDRAVTDGEEEGFVKVHVRAGSDQIIGATIVGRHAGELINELTLAMNLKAGLGRLSSVIHPYPTLAESIRKSGDAYNRSRLTPLVKQAFSRWLAWTR